MGKLFYRGNKWGITFIDPNGKQVRKVISEFKEAAREALKKTEREIYSGTYFKIDPVKFEDFVEEFVSNYINLENRNPKAQMGRINDIRNYFKGRYLHQIDARMIRKFLAEKKQTLKPSTVNRFLSMIRCMYNRAIEWKLINGQNPTVGIKKLHEDNERSCFLTDSEQIKLLSHCHGMTHRIVHTALQTGLRWSEIMSLQWTPSESGSYVDFDNGLVVIHSANSKSKKSRFIPMSYSLQCELFDLKKTSTSKFIFANPKTGKPYNNIRRSFLRAVKEAGFKGITPHSLRHVFASSLVSKGVDLYVVQQLLGHSTPRMTQRYAHLKPEQFKRAIDQINFSLDKFSVKSDPKYDVESTSCLNELKQIL